MWRAGRLEFFPDHAKLIDRAAFKGWIKPLYDIQVARPRQATGPDAVWRISPLHASWYELPGDLGRREGHHIQIERLPYRRSPSLLGHDAAARRVHSSCTRASTTYATKGYWRLVEQWQQSLLGARDPIAAATPVRPDAG